MKGITNEEAIDVIEENIQTKTVREGMALNKAIKVMEAINQITTLLNEWREGKINDLTAYNQFEEILARGDFV